MNVEGSGLDPLPPGTEEHVSEDIRHLGQELKLDLLNTRPNSELNSHFTFRRSPILNIAVARKT
jgi:hypothetical protein